MCLTAPWQWQRSLQARSDRSAWRGVGVEGTRGLQQIENSPLSRRFVRLTRSFTSASVLRGVIVRGSRKDARMHRNWDVWRFITSVTSLNTQSEQWDPHYKWGPWQYKKNLCIASACTPDSNKWRLYVRPVFPKCFKLCQKRSGWKYCHNHTDIYNHPWIKKTQWREKKKKKTEARMTVYTFKRKRKKHARQPLWQQSAILAFSFQILAADADRKCLKAAVWQPWCSHFRCSVPPACGSLCREAHTGSDTALQYLYPPKGGSKVPDTGPAVSQRRREVNDWQSEPPRAETLRTEVSNLFINNTEKHAAITCDELQFVLVTSFREK